MPYINGFRPTNYRVSSHHIMQAAQNNKGWDKPSVPPLKENKMLNGQLSFDAFVFPTQANVLLNELHACPTPPLLLFLLTSLHPLSLLSSSQAMRSRQVRSQLCI